MSNYNNGINNGNMVGGNQTMSANDSKSGFGQRVRDFKDNIQISHLMIGAVAIFFFFGTYLTGFLSGPGLSVTITLAALIIGARLYQSRGFNGTLSYISGVLAIAWLLLMTLTLVVPRIEGSLNMSPLLGMYDKVRNGAPWSSEPAYQDPGASYSQPGQDPNVGGFAPSFTPQGGDSLTGEQQLKIQELSAQLAVVKLNADRDNGTRIVNAMLAIDANDPEALRTQSAIIRANKLIEVIPQFPKGGGNANVTIDNIEVRNVRNALMGLTLTVVDDGATLKELYECRETAVVSINNDWLTDQQFPLSRCVLNQLGNGTEFTVR